MSTETPTEEDRAIDQLTNAALVYANAVLAKVLEDDRDGDPDETAKACVQKATDKLVAVARKLGIISLATDAAIAERRRPVHSEQARLVRSMPIGAAGSRERDALTNWWHCVAISQDVHWPANHKLEDVITHATYDPVLDAITWGSQSATIEQIGRMIRDRQLAPLSEKKV